MQDSPAKAGVTTELVVVMSAGRNCEWRRVENGAGGCQRLFIEAGAADDSEGECQSAHPQSEARTINSSTRL